MSHFARAFVARQPILDRRQRVVGYELLYRASADAERAEIEDPALASLQTLIAVFVNVGTDTLLGRHAGFLNVPAHLLLSEVVEALPKDRVVLELGEVEELDPVLRARARQLRQRGFRIALDDYLPGDEREPLLPDVDYVKVDLPSIHPSSLPLLLRDLRRACVRCVAEKVETRETFDRARALGFDLFQGYYFARPATLSGVSVDATRTAIFELFRLLREEDDIGRIEEAFKRHAALGLNLLRLVNCVALARVEKIATIRQALVLLGNRQLERWLLMLLFAGGDPHGASRLLLQAASTRGRLLELVAQRLEDPGEGAGSGVPDRAFVTGLLSLVDVLLESPLEEVLDRLRIDDEIRHAVVEHAGPLGALLELAIRLERADFDAVAAALPSLGLRVEELLHLQCESFRWATAVERAGELGT